jgi:hypothetical protein
MKNEPKTLSDGFQFALSVLDEFKVYPEEVDALMVPDEELNSRQRMIRSAIGTIIAAAMSCKLGSVPGDPWELPKEGESGETARGGR